MENKVCKGTGPFYTLKPEAISAKSNLKKISMLRLKRTIVDFVICQLSVWSMTIVKPFAMRRKCENQ